MHIDIYIYIYIHIYIYIYTHIYIYNVCIYIYIYICINTLTKGAVREKMATARADPVQAETIWNGVHEELGWLYLSNATCPMRPHVFSTASLV